MSTTDEENLLKVLEIETSRISQLDSTLFTIKGWAVTLVSALVGFALNNKESTAKKELLILAVVSAATFMITDIVFRRVQLRHVVIVTRIKKLLQEKSGASNLNVGELNIWGRIWNNEFERKKNSRDFTQFFKDYLYTLLLYGSVIFSLIYLTFRYSQ